MIDGGGEVLVRLEGDLDFATAPGLLARLNGTFNTTHNPTVRLDLSRLLFLDTDGARALLRLGDFVAERGGQLRVDGIVNGRLPAADHLGLYRLLVVDPGEGTDHRT